MAQREWGKGCLHWRSILLVRWLCRVLGGRFLGRPVEYLDVELPSLNVFAGLLAGDYDHQFRDLAACHPFVELRHDLLDVCFDLIVGSDKHVESILLDPEIEKSDDMIVIRFIYARCEILCGIYAALESGNC